MSGNIYTQGVCEDGATILCNGIPMAIEEILELLNRWCDGND